MKEAFALVSLSTPLADVFSTRIVNAASWAGDERLDNPTIGDLLEQGPESFRRARNIGPHSRVEVHRLMWRLAKEVLAVRDGEPSRLDAIELRLAALEDSKEAEREKPFGYMRLSVRSTNILNTMGVSTIGDITRFTENDLLLERHCGVTAVREIKRRLGRYGLSLRGSAVEMEDELCSPADDLPGS